MWRPETIREKAARENPQVTVTAVPPQPPTMTREEIRKGYEADGCGWCPDISKAIKYALYVVCCCGCDTNYEDFEG